MTTNDLLDAIYNWCSTELASVRWQIAYINDAPFDLKNNPAGIGVINLIYTQDVGQDISVLTYNPQGDDFTQTIDKPKYCTFSINIYGNDSYNIAERLRTSVFFESVNNAFVSAGLGYISSSDVKNLTQLVSTNYEKRAQFDITFYVNFEYNKNIERMVEVRVRGDFDEGRHETDQTIIAE